MFPLLRMQRKQEKNLRKSPPDIMRDIEMPVGNGLDLFGRVKENNYKTCCVI